MSSTARLRPGRRAFFAALATAALIVPVASADAKPPRSFYGLTPQAQLGPYEVERMGAGRVGMLRISIAWAAIDQTPIPGDTDWTLYDQLVAQSAYHGIQILPVFDNVPGWVAHMDNCAERCHRFAPRSELALAAWRNFLRSAVQRYGPGGAFWVQNPSIPPMPFTAWQIWNEQNSDEYIAPDVDADVYAKLVTEASRAIKEIDPAARVVLGGMFATPMGAAGDPKNRSWVYLRRLYNHTGFKESFDGVAIHPYSRTMRQVRLQIQLNREEMKKAGDARTPLWITEIGWSSRRGEYYLEVGKSLQAKLLRKSFTYFTRQRKRLHIKTVNWFSWRDTPPGVELCVWCDTSGLFTREGFDAKPAWRAFTRFTGGR